MPSFTHLLSFESVNSFFAAYGLLFAFGLGVFEEVAFFIPSTMFFVALGFFAIDPELKFLPALGVAVLELGISVSLGILLGGILVYWLVYWGGKPAVMRWGKYFRVRWEDIERLHRLFESRGADKGALLFLRVVPAFPIGVVSIFSGLIRFRFSDFAWITFFGSIPRVGLLALAGWYLGKGFVRYEGDVSRIEHYALIALCALLLAFLLHRKTLRLKAKS